MYNLLTFRLDALVILRVQGVYALNARIINGAKQSTINLEIFVETTLYHVDLVMLYRLISMFSIRIAEYKYAGKRGGRNNRVAVRYIPSWDWKGAKILNSLHKGVQFSYSCGSESRTWKLRLLYGDFVWGNFNMADRTAGQLESALHVRVSNSCANAFER